MRQQDVGSKLGQQSLGRTSPGGHSSTYHKMTAAEAGLIGRSYGVKPGVNQMVGATNMRQQLLDKNEEQMIIKSACASNHELVKKIEQSGGMYLIEV